MNPRLTNRQKRAFSVQRILALTDTHFQAPLKNGDVQVRAEHCHSPEAISVILQIMRDFSPDVVVHLGDLYEMASVSHWNRVRGRDGQVRGSDKQWYQTLWKPQMQMGEALWGHIANAHPSAKLVQLEGNHDLWAREAFTRPELSQFAGESLRNQSIWKQANITYIPYDSESPYYTLGDGVNPMRSLRLIHGYNAKANKMQAQHLNVVYGDSHRIQAVRNAATSWGVLNAWNIGCACNKTPEFSSIGGRQNGWEHGLGLIYMASDYQSQVEIVPITNGRVLNCNGRMYTAGALSRGLKCLEVPV